MNKKIMVVVCIVVALLSFMGGVLYRYDEYAPTIEGLQEDNDSLQSQLDAFYIVPMDIDLAYRWLNWVTEQYQYRIDNEIFTEDMPLEYYQVGIDMFNSIRDVLRGFNE